eukprot:2790380-Pyramimonas_sp.AAC.1
MAAQTGRGARRRITPSPNGEASLEVIARCQLEARSQDRRGSKSRIVTSSFAADAHILPCLSTYAATKL